MIERFISKIDFGDDDECCWLWTASKNTKGYGHFRLDGKVVGAHRVAYELWVGSIPQGLEIDHLCRTPPCVNPAHMEPVTRRINVLRGVSFAAVFARRTHCGNGHLLSGKNVYIDPHGARICKICRRLIDKSRRPLKGNFCSRKTHCPQGHLYSGDNLYTSPSSGYRQCRECRETRRKRAVA